MDEVLVLTDEEKNESANLQTQEDTDDFKKARESAIKAHSQ